MDAEVEKELRRVISWYMQAGNPDLLLADCRLTIDEVSRNNGISPEGACLMMQLAFSHILQGDFGVAAEETIALVVASLPKGDAAMLNMPTVGGVN